MAQCISVHTRNRITTPIHCMYISDTIWVQCIPMHTQNCINTVIHFLYTFTQSGYYSHNVGIFRLNAQPISGSLRLHERVIVQFTTCFKFLSFFILGTGKPLPRLHPRL